MRSIAGELSFRMQLVILGWAGRVLRRPGDPMRQTAAALAAWIFAARRQRTEQLLDRFERRTYEIREQAELLKRANRGGRLN